MRILVDRGVWLGAWLVVLAAALSGCTGETTPEAEGTLGRAEGAVEAHNAFTVNAFTVNSLEVATLNLSALDATALAPVSLAAIRDSGPDGDRSREFVRYAVTCAFTATQTFEFTWTDAQNVDHDEVYAGELGVAPEWATGALSESGQHMVSACLAAVVNYYGTPVLISMRAPEAPLKAIDPDELEDYANVEGAFWGNLWDDTAPFIHACYNSDTIANSRFYMRDCAVGHLLPNSSIEECGMIDIVGPCSDVCVPVNGDGHHPGCVEHPGQSLSETEHVITVALP